MKQLITNVLVKKDPLSITLHETDIIKELRMPAAEITASLQKQLDAARQTAQSLMTPKAVYCTFKIKESTPAAVIVEDAPVFLTGSQIHNMLAPCSYVSLLLVTIGCALEQTAEKTFSASPLRSYLLDAIGSTAAEACACSITMLLQQEMSVYNLIPTHRYSPGFGDWPLSSQKVIYTIVHAHELGVSLIEDSYLLMPQKSVSAVIGWRLSV